MTDQQHPAVTFLLAAHERALALAEPATRGPWAVDDERYPWAIYGAGDAAVVSGGRWGGEASVFDSEHDARFIAANHPDTVLRRVVAERGILAEHAGTWASGEPEYSHHHEVVVGANGRTRYIEVDDDDPIEPYMCITCEAPGWPCRTVLGLAKAWGWKETT